MPKTARETDKEEIHLNQHVYYTKPPTTGNQVGATLMRAKTFA